MKDSNNFKEDNVTAAYNRSKHGTCRIIPDCPSYLKDERHSVGEAEYEQLLTYAIARGSTCREQD